MSLPDDPVFCVSYFTSGGMYYAEVFKSIEAMDKGIKHAEQWEFIEFDRIEIMSHREALNLSADYGSY